ncbi:hypothetical protein DPMN_177918 [Dreissena polymorpha]|uniref:Uncharacterized protein n=2 Tax=Dreissena polymorpha TaxID=45954 RepID=A0A9D4ECE4_DREPO|nr:hypothetical protein DPMN_177884 [Dreissena polymorpha]KAH3776492.1 hypothetical protein DPMN_177918 [Dreissena polymorpha]
MHFKASAFMEPYSQLVHGTKLNNYTVPSLMYGTPLSEDGFPNCNVRGYDCIQFYNIWKYLRVALEVAVSV